MYQFDNLISIEYSRQFSHLGYHQNPIIIKRRMVVKGDETKKLGSLP
jgi:hypothetical protein